ncbi:ribosomal protein uS17 [Metamycoplasma hyosynoviae]|uniref:Small ribosomal subunit protein uS17 n=1 Tax=Metamycoplasma hyosynoviae TaxID=29559 RepID=A0A4R7TRQ8_9BACT|nr:ribosomal protein uS17 [Metamycoplasma hyosynoviae]
MAEELKKETKKATTAKKAAATTETAKKVAKKSAATKVAKAPKEVAKTPAKKADTTTKTTTKKEVKTETKTKETPKKVAKAKKSASVQTPINRPNNRKILVGTVISIKNNKTITVLVEEYKKHPLYSKRFKNSKKFAVHDENNTAKVGDVVKIQETRPLSKTKHFRLVEIREHAIGGQENA